MHCTCINFGKCIYYNQVSNNSWQILQKEIFTVETNFTFAKRALHSLLLFITFTINNNLYECFFHASEFRLLDLVNLNHIWVKMYIIMEEDHEKLKIVSMYK